MTEQFIADPTVREKYGLSDEESFDDAFSRVSIENIIFYIVAAAIHVLESMFDSFIENVDDKVATAVVASLPWYYKIALEYQHGDELAFDETTQEFVYPSVDASKQVIKYAAAQDRGGGVAVLVSGETAGLPSKLPDEVLEPFRAYMTKRKPAGVILQVYSYDPDDIIIEVEIQIDPLVLNEAGQLLSDNSVYPVENAINSYLQNIVYGGVFNKTKLVDAIQQAAGVADVTLESVKAKAAAASDYKTLATNNYRAVSGAFVAQNLREGITYVV